MQSNIREKLFGSMSEEQESRYILTVAERILRCDGYLLWVIIGVQAFNLLYALIYTNGKLHSVSSRVYSSLYLFLMLLSVIGLFLHRYLKKNLPAKAMLTVRLQVIYGFLLILWGACTTAYDQRVSDNVTVYLIVAFTVSVLVYMTPGQAAVSFVTVQIFLFLAIPAFQTDSTRLHGVLLNTVVMTLLSFLIAVYRYSNYRKGYLIHQEMLEKNRILNEAANHDSLTGLYNRRFLNGQMDEIYRYCARNQRTMTIMMMDIDSFKNYNDTYGHQQGDECLRRMTWRLLQEMDPKQEYLIRYGGEEFLYVGTNLDHKTAQEKAEEFTKVIRDLIIGPSEKDPRNITISIGLFTEIPSMEMAEDKEWINSVARADSALYEAKNSGKDQWIDFSVQ